MWHSNAPRLIPEFYETLPDRKWRGPYDVLLLVQGAAFTMSSVFVLDSFLKNSLQEQTVAKVVHTVENSWGM